jgi:hypothetical protein
MDEEARGAHVDEEATPKDLELTTHLEPERTRLRIEAQARFESAIAEHLKADTLPGGWDLESATEEFVSLIGRHLRGYGTVTLRTDGLAASISVASDGRGRMCGTSGEEEELSLAMWRLSLARGGTLVVRGTQPELLTDESMPDEIFGWFVRDGNLCGMGEGEAFDELCRDAQDELSPPRASVRCVSLAQ